jgi:hypothetical protein
MADTILKVITGVIVFIMIVVVVYFFFIATLGVLQDYNNFRKTKILPNLLENSPCCYDNCTCWQIGENLCNGIPASTDTNGVAVPAAPSIDCFSTDPAICKVPANYCGRTNQTYCSPFCKAHFALTKPTVCTATGPTPNPLSLTTTTPGP